MKILIHKKVLDVIACVMESHQYKNKERQAMLRVDMSDPNHYKICDYYMIPQKNTSGATEGIEDSMTYLFNRLSKQDREDEFNEWCCWYHSHNQMRPFWSGQDNKNRMDNIKDTEIHFSIVSGYGDTKNPLDFVYNNIFFHTTVDVGNPYNVEIDATLEMYSDEEYDAFVELIDECDIKMNSLPQELLSDLEDEEVSNLKTLLKISNGEELQFKFFQDRVNKIKEERADACEEQLFSVILEEYNDYSEFYPAVVMENLSQAEKEFARKNQKKLKVNKKFIGRNYPNSKLTPLVERDYNCPFCRTRKPTKKTKNGTPVCDICDNIYSY